MTAFSESVSAPTAELSFLAAMGEFRLAPSVLDGTLRTGQSSDQHNAQIFAAREAEVSAEIERIKNAVENAGGVQGIELAEGETLVADLREEGAIVEVEGDLAEVVAIIEDAEGTWVRVVPSELGEALDYRMADWQDEFGVAGENEILSAWDRVEIARMRRELIAA